MDLWCHVSDENFFLCGCDCTCLEGLYRLEYKRIILCSSTRNEVRFRSCVFWLRTKQFDLVSPLVEQQQQQQQEEQDNWEATPVREQPIIFVAVRRFCDDTITTFVNIGNIADIVWIAATFDFKFVKHTVSVIILIDFKACDRRSIW